MDPKLAKGHRRRSSAVLHRVAVCLVASVTALAMLLVLVSGPPSYSATSHAVSPANKASTSPNTATGYFSVAQKPGGGWTLVTPQGQPFYASGIDTVSPQGSGTDRATGICPYCEYVANNYPSTAAWASATVSQLRSWGFNSLGPYSDDTGLGSQMPFEVQLSMASGDDWFAPSFVTNADQVAAENVAPLANDPNVIGYFTDSELDWGPLLGNDNNGDFLETALQQYLQLPAGSPGLVVAQQYAGNPSGFLTALATRYFSVTTAAVRMYDSNHLILGVKAEGQEIEPQLLEAAAPYVNVFSIEDYMLAPGFDQAVTNTWPAYLPVQQNLADLEAIANVPLMIGEYSFSSTVNSSGDPDTQPSIYETASSQQQRASQYEDFIAPLYEDTPNLVGDDWFQYVDEPPGGRTGDLENSDFGMVDVNGNPYPTMNAAALLMHNVIADETGDNGPVCDSWATGSSGVQCTAYMPSSASSPLTIVTISLPAGNVGASYGSSFASSDNLSAGVYAAGGTPGYTYSVTRGSLPPGLTLNTSTGQISGVPTTSGTSSFTVEAMDSAGSPPASQALSITIDPEVPVRVAVPYPPGNPVQGQPYQFVLNGSGGSAPYTWTIVSGGLPPGLTLNSRGSINGNATESGTFHFTVEVTDSSSPPQQATQNLTLNVPPTTSVYLPASGATVQGDTWLDAGASSQNAIASVQFEISGGSISDKVIGTGVPTLYGYLLYFNTSSVPNGSYSIQSVATDEQGLSATSASVAVTISNPPSTNVLLPSNGATLSGSLVVVDASATNATSVQYLLFGGSYGYDAPVICTATPTLFGWICEWNSTAVPDGQYVLVSVASGPTGTAYSSGVSVAVDNRSAPG